LDGKDKYRDNNFLSDEEDDSEVPEPYVKPDNVPLIPGFEAVSVQRSFSSSSKVGQKYVAYTIKLPSDQLAALQSIWLELKRLYGTHSPDKSGMIQQAVQDWLKRWDGPERQQLLNELLEIREDTRRRQYNKKN
jgi:hypothetical protein